MLISIIVPCYNHATHLARAVESVAEQLQGLIEVIIVNDGSTDNTEDEARKLMVRYANVCLVSKPNGGLSSARNAGIRVARGKWLHFLDADDYIRPGMFDAFREYLIQHSAVDLVYVGNQVVSPDLAIRSETPGCDLPEDVSKAILLRNWMPVHSVVCRKALFDRWGLFDEKLTACEDWDVWMRFALQGAIFGHIPMPFAVYVAYPDSMSSFYVPMLRNALRAYKNNRALVSGSSHLLNAWNLGMRDLRPRYFRMKVVPVLKRDIENKRYARAAMSLIKIFIQDPLSSIFALKYIRSYFLLRH